MNKIFLIAILGFLFSLSALASQTAVKCSKDSATGIVTCDDGTIVKITNDQEDSEDKKEEAIIDPPASESGRTPKLIKSRGASTRGAK